jgi:hypothetical protein
MNNGSRLDTRRYVVDDQRIGGPMDHIQTSNHTRAKTDARESHGKLIRIQTPAPVRSAAAGAFAIGALAVGATAVGALAIGRLAIGALALRRARVRSLEVDELTVGRLHIRELVIDRDETAGWAASVPEA